MRKLVLWVGEQLWSVVNLQFINLQVSSFFRQSRFSQWFFSHKWLTIFSIFASFIRYIYYLWYHIEICNYSLNSSLTSLYYPCFVCVYSSVYIVSYSSNVKLCLKKILVYLFFCNLFLFFPWYSEKERMQDLQEWPYSIYHLRVTVAVFHALSILLSYQRNTLPCAYNTF